MNILKIEYEYKCSDCGINVGVFKAQVSSKQLMYPYSIDICQSCLDKRNKIYDHAISFNFSIETSNETPTVEEMKEAVLRYFNILNNDEIKASFEVFDSEEKEDELYVVDAIKDRIEYLNQHQFTGYEKELAILNKSLERFDKK